MRGALLTIGLALGPLLAAAQGSLAPATLFEQISPSVWTVRTLDADHRPLMQGSAVVIGPGRLVTNCHVLLQARAVAVARENLSYGATLQHPDTERDLFTLSVANFNAPPVAIAPAETLRVGSRVHAIGSPRGLDTTIGHGLLSGIRRNAQNAIEALQISVPISAGSSGGGLFDEQGRLIGITSAGLRDSQNLNFALPAAWIAEVPARAQAALAHRQQAPTTTGRAKERPTGSVFVYRLHDRRTGIQRSVTRHDPPSSVQAGAALDAGEFDLAMPPSGWIASPPEVGSAWRLDYIVQRGEVAVTMQLRARATETTPLRIGEREYTTVRVNFNGYTRRRLPSMGAEGTYAATAWYAPELKRVVRFQVDMPLRQGSSSYARADELLELVDIRSE